MLTALMSRIATRLPAPPIGWTGPVPGNGLRAAWTAWRRERDVRAVERALGRLSDRQLALIGMSRSSIEIEVSGLIDRTEHGRMVTDEVLRLVDRTPPRVPLLQQAA
jgi:uncharacterized protein YjiS (DUF1127 family)